MKVLSIGLATLLFTSILASAQNSNNTPQPPMQPQPTVELQKHERMGPPPMMHQGPRGPMGPRGQMMHEKGKMKNHKCKCDCSKQRKR
jgi:hypothetical protein